MAFSIVFRFVLTESSDVRSNLSLFDNNFHQFHPIKAVVVVKTKKTQRCLHSNWIFQVKPLEFSWIQLNSIAFNLYRVLFDLNVEFHCKILLANKVYSIRYVANPKAIKPLKMRSARVRHIENANLEYFMQEVVLIKL